MLKYSANLKLKMGGYLNKKFALFYSLFLFLLASITFFTLIHVKNPAKYLILLFLYIMSAPFIYPNFLVKMQVSFNEFIAFTLVVFCLILFFLFILWVGGLIPFFGGLCGI